MKIRALAVAGALAVALVVTGCATSIAGQAEVAAGAVADGSGGTSNSASQEPSGSEQAGPTGSGSGTDGPSSGPATADSSQGGPETAPPTDGETTDDDSPSGDSSTSAPATPESDDSVVPTIPTTFAGLSADCNKILAAITAFSSILQGGASGDVNAKITQAAVDAALKQLPASGLPAQPQADINILRATVSGSVGKTIAELGMTMTDWKVVAALQDLSTYTASSCT